MRKNTFENNAPPQNQDLHREVFVLSTEIMIVNAINLIYSEQNPYTYKICILIGRVATEQYFSKLANTGIFEKIYIIDYQEPRPKFWIRNLKTRAIFSPLEVFLYLIRKNKIPILKKHYFNTNPDLYDELANCSDFYFHNFNDLTKPLLSTLSKRTRIHLLEEGTASYLKTTIPINNIFAIHLYDPDLAIYKTAETSRKFKAIPQISTHSTKVLSTLRELYPSIAPLEDSHIYFDQPMGTNPNILFQLISPHYRRQKKEYLTRLNLVKHLLSQNSKIAVRLHPSNLVNDKFNKGLSKLSKVQKTHGNAPFELELICSKNTHFEFYSLYSTAACLWRLMINDDLLLNKEIKVHLLYPELKNKLPDVADAGISDLLLSFLEKLALKYPKNFVLG